MPSIANSLYFSDVNYVVGEKVILKDVCGTAEGGQLLAIMGPTGAGKTSLLSVLANRVGNEGSEGDIRFGDYQWSKALQRHMGFVEQDDVVLESLTVREFLTFTARLRLPASMSAEDKARRVTEVTDMLNLTKCVDTCISDVSGGERKRTAICHELLTEPSILFLDEPTSGLDSSTALTVVRSLRALCETGITCVASIHQPSGQIFSLFDKLLILADGQVTFHGEASAALPYFESLGFPRPADWSTPDHIMELAVRGKLKDHAAKFSADFGSLPAEDRRRTRALLYAGEGDRDGHGAKVALPPRFAAGYTEQLRVLASRNWRMTKSGVYTHTLLFQYVSLGVLTGVLWWQLGYREADIESRITFIFWETATWEFFPLFNALFTFATNEDVLKKELSSDSYRLSAYFLARTLVAAPLELLWPTLHSCIAWGMTVPAPGFTPFLWFLLLQYFNTLVSQAAGFAISAIVVPSKLLVACIIVMTVMFNFTGFLVPIRLIPEWIVWLKHVSITRYVHSTMMRVVFNEDVTFECKSGSGDAVSAFPDCPQRAINSDDILRQNGIEMSLTTSLLCLLVMLVGCYWLAMGGLAFRYRHANKYWVDVASPEDDAAGRDNKRHSGSEYTRRNSGGTVGIPLVAMSRQSSENAAQGRPTAAAAAAEEGSVVLDVQEGALDSRRVADAAAVQVQRQRELDESHLLLMGELAKADEEQDPIAFDVEV